MDSAAIFFALFELVSAFGNVGLSLGPLEHKNGDFSRDLGSPALFIIAVVALVGRTRGLPSTIDASLTLPKIDPSALQSTLAPYQPPVPDQTDAASPLHPPADAATTLHPRAPAAA